jgi:hypothetical protein
VLTLDVEEEILPACMYTHTYIQAVLLYNIVGADLGCGGGNTYILHVCIHIRVFKQYCFTISI